jgi:hypothetical protein
VEDFDIFGLDANFWEFGAEHRHGIRGISDKTPRRHFKYHAQCWTKNSSKGKLKERHHAQNAFLCLRNLYAGSRGSCAFLSISDLSVSSRRSMVILGTPDRFLELDGMTYSKTRSYDVERESIKAQSFVIFWSLVSCAAYVDCTPAITASALPANEK